MPEGPGIGKDLKFHLGICKADQTLKKLFYKGLSQVLLEGNPEPSGHPVISVV